MLSYPFSSCRKLFFLAPFKAFLKGRTLKNRLRKSLVLKAKVNERLKKNASSPVIRNNKNKIIKYQELLSSLKKISKMMMFWM